MLTTWHYVEMLQGNTYIGWVLDDQRIVCCREYHGIDVQNPGQEIEQTRRELQEIASKEAYCISRAAKLLGRPPQGCSFGLLMDEIEDKLNPDAEPLPGQPG